MYMYVYMCASSMKAVQEKSICVLNSSSENVAHTNTVHVHVCIHVHVLILSKLEHWSEEELCQLYLFLVALPMLTY